MDRIDPRCRVCLAPTVVVLTDGEQQRVTARMLGQPVGPPQRQELAGQPGVVRLSDDPQLISIIDNDHGVDKNNQLEDSDNAFSDA